MKVFLVVMAIWDMAYRGIQITPVLVQEMPSMEACEAVAKAFADLSYHGSEGKYISPTKCVRG